MATREIHRIKCREHGGYFNRPAQRGRPPVRCTESNQCDAVTIKPVSAKGAARAVSRTLRGEAPKPSKSTSRSRAEHAAGEQEPAHNTPEPATAPKQRVGSTRGRQASVNNARVAREQLEPLGWSVAGRAYGSTATITAARGDELLVATWTDGKLTEQTYSLWNVDKPSLNGKPPTNLPFDPEEIPDKELAQLLHGVKVTWWNRLGQMEETAVVSPEKLSIEHLFSGLGNETPGDRVIKFTDHSGHGFKAFRLNQLIKVG